MSLATAAISARRTKSRPTLPKRGGLKSAGTMPKSPPRRNAAEGKNGRFRKVFAPKLAIYKETPKHDPEKAGAGSCPNNNLKRDSDSAWSFRALEMAVGAAC